MPPRSIAAGPWPLTPFVARACILAQTGAPGRNSRSAPPLREAPGAGYSAPPLGHSFYIAFFLSCVDATFSLSLKHNLIPNRILGCVLL